MDQAGLENLRRSVPATPVQAPVADSVTARLAGMGVVAETEAAQLDLDAVLSLLDGPPALFNGSVMVAQKEPPTVREVGSRHKLHSHQTKTKGRRKKRDDVDDQVGRGVRLVGETGETLDQILGQVAEINDLVGEIAASSKEQAVGLAEVNQAVNQMDQVTQQNAAMVEQSTAASHALSNEAAELERLIGRFQVGGEVRQMPSRTERAVPVAPRREAFRERYVQGANALKFEPQSRPGEWEEF